MRLPYLDCVPRHCTLRLQELYLTLHFSVPAVPVKFTDVHEYAHFCDRH